MVTLRAFDLCWAPGEEDDPADQCVHGGIELSVLGESLYRTDADLTVSAACLYLLRTIEDDHTPERSVAEGNWLFPHCGFSVWASEGRYLVDCIGCNQGTDIWIRHTDQQVALSWDGRCVTIPLDAWARAVLGLAEQVEAYYRQSQAKEKIEDEYNAEGWALFWMEWEDHKQRAVPRGT